MDLKAKVISGLRWSAAAKFLGQLFTWAITIVVIRLLSPADYGLMALAGVFVAFLAMLNELGLGAAVVQNRDLDDDSLRALFGMVLFTSAFFYLLLALAAPFIAAFYDDSRLVSLVRVLALQFIVVGLSVLPQSILLREMRFREIAAIDFISAIAGAVTTLVLAWKGEGVWALVWGSLVIRGVSTVGLNLAQPFLRRPRFTIKGMMNVFAFGGYVTLSRVLWYLYSKADTLILGKVLGKDLLGFYSVGMYLASLPMEKTSGIINQVAFPAFSSVQSDERAAGSHFLKAVRVMSFFAFPLLWGLSAIAPEVVDVFLGPKWSAAALPLQMIAIVIPVRMISNLMNPAILGMGRADVSFTNSLLSFLIMPVAFLVGSFWGVFGVSLAWTVAFPLVFVLNLSRVAKVMNLKMRDIFKAMERPFVCGLLMYGGLHALRYAQITTSAIVQSIILTVCGAAIYILSSMWINRESIEEIKKLARA